MARKHAPNVAVIEESRAAPRLWGRHAAFAALDNPARTVRKLWVTSELRNQLVIDPEWPLVVAEVADLGRMVPNDAPHQGIVVEVDPAPRPVPGRRAGGRPHRSDRVCWTR